MKRKTQKNLCLLLGAVMIISLLAGSLLAVPTAAADTVDPKKIDKVIVNMRYEDAMIETMNLYVHTPTAGEPDPYTGGKITFSEEKEAMQLVYAQNQRQPDYRAMLRFNKKNTITEEFKYWVIVYDVKSSAPYRFTLWNSPKAGPEIVISEGDKIDTDGFVVSEPYDISKTNEYGSMISRWLGTNMNTLGFETEDANAEVYIKEYGFFKSVEDANAYYSAIDLDKDPIIYSADSDYVDPATLPDPVFIRFYKNGLEMMQNGGAFFYNDAGEQGKYESVQMDGQYVLKLNYAPSDKWEAYRVMPKFSMPNLITTDHKYMRIVYMTTDTTANQITLYNNAGSGQYTLVGNTAASKGEWIPSDVIDISTSQVIDRFITGKHCTLEYTSKSPDSQIYIKEIGFFSSLAQAGQYYGDTVNTYKELTFGIAGNAGFYSGANFGVYTVNDNDATLDITYAESTNMKVHYSAKLKFNDAKDISPEYYYARILYSAQHPTDMPENSTVSLTWYNDNGGDNATFVSKVADTNGEFVLSKTTKLSEGMMDRLCGTTSGRPMHASLNINANGTDGLYRIKAIYFFPTREAAELFTIENTVSKITINGNDISKYQIVIAKDAAAPVEGAAKNLANYVKTISKVELPIATDDAPLSEYEILIGKSTRPKSTERIEALMANGYDYTKYLGCIDGNTAVIVAEQAANSLVATNEFCRNYLYMGIDNPELIEIKSGSYFDASSSYLEKFDEWRPVTNVVDPDVITDDFSADDGTWTEESGASDWSIAGGVMSTVTDDYALSYIHVYEQNAQISSKLTYSNAGSGADFGLMLRYTAPDAWIKAGYDVTNGEWYIIERQGLDFYTERLASVKSSLSEGKQYSVTFKVDGDKAYLTVDDILLLTASVSHITPGRPAIYADSISLTVDDASITLLSGQGTVIKNLTHTKLPTDQYLEGGSAWEMSDGNIYYQHSTGISYRSLDKGYTWEECEKWFDSTNGYPNILRLLNGDLITTATKVIDGTNCMITKTSSDEGKTWVDGGKICARYYPDSTAGAGNMNDKLLQTASGRIFYGQNYEVQDKTTNVDGRYVFCEFYYSDDNGKTWIKSETDSWELVGNEDQAWFGESKMLECADGTIRMYNSWNDYGCVVYAESTDGGKTFGPIVTMPELECARSSMQFFRDPYAENDTTYYMVWVNSQQSASNATMTRGGISLAKTTDGKNWNYLGDIWKWHSGYLAPETKATINQVVDPFVYVTETTVIVGSGIGEQIKKTGDNNYHQAQRQHIWTIDKASLGEGSPINKFTDISLGAPYYDAITYVSDNELFKGVSDTEFAHNTIMSRSMFVTVLGRLDGVNQDNYKTVSFTDVVANSWYAPYVEWAASKSIVNGIGNGLYGIDNAITIEQACLILMRYSGNKSGISTGITSASYPDAGSISSWAKDGVEWALANGIYDGQSGMLNPTAPASRSTVAEMFYNYANVIGK